MTVNNEDMKQEVLDFLGNEVPEGFEEDSINLEEEEFFAPEDPVEDPVEEPIVNDDPPAEEELPAESIPAEEPEPIVEPEPEPEPELEPEPEPALSAVDTLVAELRDQNATLQEQIKAIQEKMDAPAPEPEAQPMPIKEGELLDFVGEADLDAILSDKEEFNKFLSGVVNQVRNNTVEQVYRNLPQMVQTQVTSQQKLQTYVDEFYKANEDLLSVRKTVGAVANEVAAEHPEMQLDGIFSETETRVRKMLGLVKEATGKKSDSPANPDGQKPALPATGARRTGTTQTPLTGQAKHIMDVL